MKSEESWGRLVMRYKLSDVMELIGGGTPKTSKAEYWNGEIPWLSVKDFNNDFRYVYETEKSITELGLNNSSTKLLKEGDIIISARGTVGEIATIPFPMAFNQSCYGLRAKEEVVTSDFLYYLIKHNVYILKKNTHGSVFDTITRDTFSGIEVDIPSLDEQRKIASILSEIDEKIELNNEINKNLEQQVSSVFDSWFVDFSQSEGTCPENWKWSILSDFADVLSGKRPLVKSVNQTDETPIPIVGAASVMGYTSEFNHSDKILVTGRVGTHGVVQRFNSPCWTSDNTLIITSKFYEFTNQILQRIDYFAMNRGSTQPLITQGDLKKVEVLLPDESTLSVFEELASTLMNQYEANLLQNKRLSELRNSLLPKLMSGDIDVSNIDL